MANINFSSRCGGIFFGIFGICLAILNVLFFIYLLIESNDSMVIFPSMQQYLMIYSVIGTALNILKIPTDVLLIWGVIKRGPMELKLWLVSHIFVILFYLCLAGSNLSFEEYEIYLFCTVIALLCYYGFAWYNLCKLCLKFIRKITQDLEDEANASLLRNEASNVPTISISISSPGRSTAQRVNVPYIIQN